MFLLVELERFCLKLLILYSKDPCFVWPALVPNLEAWPRLATKAICLTSVAYMQNLNSIPGQRDNVSCFPAFRHPKQWSTHL